MILFIVASNKKPHHWVGLFGVSGGGEAAIAPLAKSSR